MNFYPGKLKHLANNQRHPADAVKEEEEDSKLNWYTSPTIRHLAKEGEEEEGRRRGKAK